MQGRCELSAQLLQSSFQHMTRETWKLPDSAISLHRLRKRSRSDALAKLQRVEVEASKKYETELAAQKALTAQNVTHLEATLRDTVTKNQEASFYVQAENQK
eukprot:4949530-Amphidinium_carterae.1